MSSKRKHIVFLYQKYLDHTATLTEYDQLFDYLKNPENLEILKNEMNREWQSGDEADRLSPLYWEEIEMQIRKYKALERKRRLERQQRRYWWAVAASFLLIFGLSVGIYRSSGPDEYLTYRTGYNEVNKIVLDDGSQVTLNANTILKWKRDWKEVGKRVAILEGEAYFDVESILDETQKKTEFDVQTNDLTIQVIGTSFNVKSRTEKTDVYLKEGKIHLDLNEDRNDSKIEVVKSALIMNPGESVSYSSKTKNLERAESNQYANASWMAGTFMYNNESVENILLSLEEIYGVTFQIEDATIMNRKLTAQLPYSDWPIVESALELLLHARIEKNENKIIISRRQ